MKHANGGAGKNRRAPHYLDFISCSLMLSLLPSLSLFFPPSPFLPFFPYLNGSGVSANCDCLIDRYLLLERGTRKRGRGAEDEVCVLSSAGKRSSVCLQRMMDYMGGPGFMRAYVFVCVRARPLHCVTMYTAKAWQ